jgi:hypothetical protein
MAINSSLMSLTMFFFLPIRNINYFFLILKQIGLRAHKCYRASLETGSITLSLASGTIKHRNRRVFLIPINIMKLCEHRILLVLLNAREHSTDVDYASHSTIQHRPPSVLFCWYGCVWWPAEPINVVAICCNGPPQKSYRLSTV